MDSNKTKNVLKTYFILLGCLTILTMIMPESIILGGLLFLIPGIILWISPILFFYSTLLFLLLKAFEGFKKKWAIVFILLIGLGLAIPYYFNQGTLNKLNELENNDTVLLEPISHDKTIAFIGESFSPPSTQTSNFTCNSYCHGLLKDGVAKYIIFANLNGFSKESIQQNYQTKKFSLRKSAECTKIPAQKYKIGDKSFSPLARVKCPLLLESQDAFLGEADYIFYSEKIIDRFNFQYTNPNELNLIAVSADRRVILKRTDKGYNTIYQKTHIEAQPLIMPIMYSGVFGNGLNIKNGFIRITIILNRYEDIQQDLQKIFASKSPILQ